MQFIYSGSIIIIDNVWGKYMIVTCGGIKGGCGKSLISTNLVVMRSAQNKKVLFIDADEQGTSAYWTELRSSSGIDTPWTTIKLHGKAILQEINKLAKNYDDIIIDCGGRETASLRSALVITDVFLVPFRPTGFDIWTIRQVCELIQYAKSFNEKLNAYTFINCAVDRGNYNQQAQEILAQMEELKLLPVTIGLRRSFSNASNEGKGVTEIGTDVKAISEINNLYNYIFNI